MENRICFVSVDVENGIERMDGILGIFKKYNISATLFITGKILEKYRDLAEEWSKDYEIACHSFSHRFWSELSGDERKKELDDFINLYQNIFQKKPLGFRAPSHVIDKEGIELVAEKGFLYDSSVLPHYPPFKKYRGYSPPHQTELWCGGKGRGPSTPYRPPGLKILEIPVSGQLLGIPLAAAWLAKLPFWFYQILFSIYCPAFVTLNWHSWSSLKNFEKIIKLLRNKNYQFLNGECILLIPK